MGCVLSRPDLSEYIREGRLVFDPAIDLSQIDQVSVDLRLGRKFTTFKQVPRYIDAIRIDPASLFESRDLWEHQEADSFILHPGDFVLAQTLERVVIPNDLVGLVEGRSSWARTGVSIHLTAPKIDPGFDGTITLEMANQGKAPVKLVAGEDKPAQLMLMTLSTPLEETEVYGSGEGDRFQYQADPIPHGDTRRNRAERAE